MPSPRVLKLISWILLAFSLVLLFLGYQNYVALKSMRESAFIGENEEILAYFELLIQRIEMTLYGGLGLLFLSISGFILAWWSKKKIAVKEGLNYVDLIDEMGNQE